MEITPYRLFEYFIIQFGHILFVGLFSVTNKSDYRGNCTEKVINKRNGIHLKGAV